MKKLLLIVMILLPTLLNAARWTSFRSDQDKLLSRKYASWEGDFEELYRNDSSRIEINNDEKVIKVGNKKYEFINIPKHWNVKQTYKTVSYECIDLQTLEKVIIYLIQYDKTKNWRLEVIHYDDLGGKSIEIYNMR